MTYDGKELTVQDSLPVWLVLFEQGAMTYRYTTISETINRDVGGGSVAWYPGVLDIGEISSSDEVPKDGLVLKLPYTNPLAYTFVSYAPDFPTTVTVWRTHRDDTEVRCMWIGRVQNSGKDERIVTLNCESIFTAVQRTSLGPCYTRNCRFLVGERGCNVNMAPYTHVLTASAALGPVVTVTGASAYDLVYGTLTAPDGTIRMIIDQDGDDLTLIRWIKSLNTALAGGPQSVTCKEGCDGTVTTCRTKYNNLGRHGAQPGIPTTNPMGANLSKIV